MEEKPTMGEVVWDLDDNCHKIYDGYKWEPVSPTKVWLMGDVPIKSFNNVRNCTQVAEDVLESEYNPADDPYYNNEDLYIPNNFLII